MPSGHTTLIALLIFAIAAVVVAKWRIVFQIVLVVMIAALIYGVLSIVREAATMTGEPTGQAAQSFTQRSGQALQDLSRPQQATAVAPLGRSG